MTVTEEFKLAVKTGKLKEAFLLLMSQTFALKITTSIEEKVKLETSINVVEGKINNQIDAAFFEHPQHNLAQKIHDNQVNIAPELLRQYVQNWYYFSQFLADESETPQIRPYIPALPPEASTQGEEWSEFLNEVEKVEVINPEESDQEDWGDWMEEDEDWENKDNNQNKPG